MQSSCYRCGAEIEDSTTFCPSCGAPQIKVAARESALTNQPSTPPSPPGTPDSVQPPILPEQLVPAGQIQWKKFWRSALPLSVISGVALVFLYGPFGVLLLIGNVAIAVSRYRRDHPGPLFASQGARLGAGAGLVSFVVAVIFGVPQMARNWDEIRRQLVFAIQQKTAGNPDPRAQQVAQWMGTNQGILVFILFSLILALAFCLLLSSAAGALTAAFSGTRQRR